MTRSLTATSINETETTRNDRHSYQTINSAQPPYDYQLIVRFSSHIVSDLLRVIRKGHTVKNAVDDAIDQCAEVYNLRDSIEDSRIRAEQTSDERLKRQHAQRGTDILHM
jgi:hypothetical protein